MEKIRKHTRPGRSSSFLGRGGWSIECASKGYEDRLGSARKQNVHLGKRVKEVVMCSGGCTNVEAIKNKSTMQTHLHPLSAAYDEAYVRPCFSSGVSSAFGEIFGA